jgi:ubiquinone/menaquinone biosynthesis C-methylase UbiE
MDKNRIKAFADKVYGDMAGVMAAGMGYVGVKTGLFKALAGRGPMTLAQVVAATGLQARYVEEWLKGMTAAGYLEYAPASETYALPPEHAYLLASEGTDHYMGGLFYMGPVLMSVAPKVAHCFRHGGGVRFEEYGPDCVEGLDVMNAGMYEQRFASYWLAKLPDVVARLEQGGRMLDVGCGAGRVGVVVARAFPKAEVIGLDLDQASIARANAAAAEAGLAPRLKFVARRTGELARGDGFDLITACDCVHDFAEPGETLRDMRALLKSDGTLFMIEPKCADRLEDNINPLAAMYYGFSIFHCMTQSLANGGPGLGTCMGPGRSMQLLRDAGFTKVEPVDIRSQTNLFYAARA